MSTPMTDDEFRLFSDWLAQEFGLRFGPEKREILRARLDPRRAALNLDSFERLLFRVRYHPDRDAERDRLVASLTNNESYFFRETNQLDVIRDEILDGLHRVARGEKRPLRIMSVGCASGEEPYTLAILAREVLGSGANIRITGIDLDPDAIGRARAASYRPHAFRSIDDAVRDRYFAPTETDRWQLRPAFTAAAQFKQGNLVAPDWPAGIPAQDLVLCRNVLIYFDEPALRRAVDNLYRVVRPGGYLFLGHAESLSRIPTRFVPERRPGAVFYQRPKE